MTPTRREFLERTASLGVAAAGAAVLAACSRADRSPRGEVVLYSSIDDFVLDAVVRTFEQDTGVRVRVAGDTEATKTTGLVTRLLSEKDRPQADVWWSSEPFGTIELARAGVLGPALDLPTGWPEHLIGRDGLWAGHALRARVIVRHPRRGASIPTDLTAWTSTAFKGRLGIARPAFGTTRGHMGMLCQKWGPEAFEAWLTALRDNDLRVYDGNATVVRKVAEGEIDAGLTDTDDVLVGQRRGWPVEMAFDAGTTMVVPCTLGLVRGGPNAANARLLAWALLGAQVERALAQGEVGHWPVHPALEDVRSTMPWQLPEVTSAGLDDVAAMIPEAMRLATRVLQ
jgi:iron(III) transport system substrate-binding protein